MHGRMPIGVFPSSLHMALIHAEKGGLLMDAVLNFVFLQYFRNVAMTRRRDSLLEPWL